MEAFISIELGVPLARAMPCCPASLVAFDRRQSLYAPHPDKVMNPHDAFPNPSVE